MAGLTGDVTLQVSSRGAVALTDRYSGRVTMSPGGDNRTVYIDNDTDFAVNNLTRNSDQTPINDAVLKGSLAIPATNPAITGATNATPIVITTATAHGLTTGDKIVIDGVVGNRAANGPQTVTVLSSTTFSLDSSVGSGAYVSGGSWWKGVTGAVGLALTYVSSSNGSYLGTIPGTLALAVGSYLRFVHCTNYAIKWGPTTVQVTQRP